MATHVRSLMVVALAAGTVLTAGAGRMAARQQDSMMHGAVRPVARGTLDPVQLRQDMRKLWSDHVIWTREYIVAAVDGTPKFNPGDDAVVFLKRSSAGGFTVAGWVEGTFRI